MRFNYLALFLIILPTFIWSQDVNLNQFYYSDVEPVELNRNESEYIEALLERYQETHEKSRFINDRDFVYEYNYYLKQLNKSGKIFYENEICDYLNKLKDFILDSEEDRNRIKIYVTDQTDLNAFTNDFGNIYVHIGAIARLKSEEELLFLLAHEISHVLLSHSRSAKVSENKARKSWTYYNGYDANGFSRTNEKAADINAIKLLINKVDLEDAAGVFDRMDESSNPIMYGRIDFSILTFGDVRRAEILDSLLNTLNKFDVLSNDSIKEELSTHPSIDTRVEKFAEEISDVDFSKIDYSATGDFDGICLQAKYILLRTYLSSEQFIEGLDLVCKMRKVDPEDDYLIHIQLRFLALITQQKYTNNVVNKFIGFKGTSCNDENFLRFKVLILKLSNIDFNDVALTSIRNALELFDLESKSELTEKATYQMLYLNNKDLFEISDSLARYNETYVSKKASFDDSLSLDQIEKLEELKLKYVAQYDTTFFNTNFRNESVLSQSEQDFISEVKQRDEPVFKVNDVQGTGEDDNLILRPDIAAKKYKRGIFLKSPNFDPAKKAALVESSFIYFNSINQYSYSIDYEKTIQLSEQLEELNGMDSSIYVDLSNSSKNGVSIYDNFIHGVMQRWVNEKLSDDKIVYSLVEDEITQYLEDTGQTTDYLVLNLCIVNKNKGKGGRNNQTFYQIYFDVKSNEAVYISAIGSKQRISKHQLRHFIYLSNYKKNT